MAAVPKTAQLANLAEVEEVRAHFVVLTRALAAEPGSPAEGATYLLPASGAISGTNWVALGAQNGDVMRFRRGGWERFPAALGLMAFVIDEALRLECVGLAPTVWRRAETRPALVTLDDLDAIGNAINTRDKYLGKVVYVDGATVDGVVIKLKYVANGPLAADWWVDDRNPGTDIGARKPA